MLHFCSTDFIKLYKINKNNIKHNTPKSQANTIILSYLFLYSFNKIFKY
uniref:Uncharacterized protein n=1 Tax=Siphoviridae sp. ctgn638 TaxID=2827913 RepID=A0A8S5TL59_9CAUD|nr:MAG TPA: hypothetical protein [Siphoviridae sp. ctgn638]